MPGHVSTSLGHGALLIDKPAGVSSFGVILRLQASFRKNLGVRPKFGHGGTLDPFASGLLVVFFGNGLKLSRYFLHGDKSYEAVMAFGHETASGDPTTPPVQSTNNMPASHEHIARAAKDFCMSPYEQVPSMYSAKKIGGMPLYALAREGMEVDREAKVCTISSFDIHEYTPPLCRFSVDCSSGTYVRTLATDLARRLGSLAHLQSLRRTACCSFDIAQAESLPELCARKNLDELLHSNCYVRFDDMLQHMPTFRIDARQRQSLINGHRAEIPALLAALPETDGDLMKLILDGKLIAVARKDAEQTWQLDRVFHD